jgi:hypothetical protein
MLRYVTKAIGWSEMDFIKSWFSSTTPSLLPGRVIVGLRDNNNPILHEHATVESLRLKYFKDWYDIESPLLAEADSLGYGELSDDVRTMNFCEANQDSTYLLSELETYLQSDSLSSTLVSYVQTKKQSDLIRKYGGLVIDISTEKDEYDDFTTINSHVLIIPKSKVTSEWDVKVPGAKIPEMIKAINSFIQNKK